MVKSKSNQQIGQGLNRRVGYILRSYPRLSQTFILNEMLALEQAGTSLQIFAITDPREEVIQSEVRQVQASVRYLEPAGLPATGASGAVLRARQVFRMTLEHLRAMLANPPGYLTALWHVLSRAEIDRGYTSARRMHCFYLALVLARLLREDRRMGRPTVDHLHAHFAHDPTLIALLVHYLTGLPFSFTAHARDLFQVLPAILMDRIRQAQAVVTCCRSNLDYLLELAPAQKHKFHMVYHGVDLRRFRPAGLPFPLAEPPLILSVGRLVEKKGFFDLLRALERVKEQGIPFLCQIYGEGPLGPALQNWIDEHGLAAQVSLAGSLPQQQLIPIFQQAALFALTPHVTTDGDRDGIPNVLVEAMAAGVPVVSTITSGIPELVVHGQNGLLFDPGDITGIASGLAKLLGSPSLRNALGHAARRQVAGSFDLSHAAIRLQALFAAIPSSHQLHDTDLAPYPPMIPVTAHHSHRPSPTGVDFFLYRAIPGPGLDHPFVPKNTCCPAAFPAETVESFAQPRIYE